MKGILVARPERCVACHGCEMACAIEHSQAKNLAAAIHESPAPQARVTVEAGERFAVPMQCRQCADAPCVAVCPTHALHRTGAENPVVIDHDLCIGCHACVLACPFGVIHFDEAGKRVIKCDQCFERLKRNERPACVEACLVAALELKTEAEVAAEKRQAYLVTVERSLDEQPGRS